MPEKIQDVDQLIRLDADWRRGLAEVEQLRRRRNEITQGIAEARKKGQDASDLMKEAEMIPGQIKSLEEKVDELLVRSLVGSELRLQPLVHSGERYCVAYS